MDKGGEREVGRVGARNRRVHVCVCVCVCVRVRVCDSQISVALSVNITLTLVYLEAINTCIPIQCCNSRPPCNKLAQKYTHKYLTNTQHTHIQSVVLPNLSAFVFTSHCVWSTQTGIGPTPG